MQKRKVLFFLVLFSFSTPILDVNAMSLQEMITEAEPNSQLDIPAGVYQENIIIDKPLHIIGTEGTVIEVNKGQAAIEVVANDVTIENIAVTYSGQEQNGAAIYLGGNNNTLRQLTIQSGGYGIYLNDAHDNLIDTVTIIGLPDVRVIEREHGILVWESHQNTIKNTVIEHVQDGIYTEASRGNHYYDNTVSNGRYGIHLMFTEKSILEKNESFGNISGMMVMGTDGTIVRDNYIHHNQRNIQSLGLLLFDVENAVISDNKIEYNRLGIFVENTSSNQILDNMLLGNYVGLQFLDAEENAIHGNAFVANIVQGQAENSANNDTDFNYWDNHQGLDRTGNGLSDLQYEVEPFLFHLTDTYPPFQLLFNSPGMVFLEQTIQTPEKEKFIDHQPLMENPLDIAEAESGATGSVLAMSLLFLVIGTTTIYLGVRK